MGYTLYYLLKSNIQTRIDNVASEALEDVENYDNSTYRDGPYQVSGVTQSFPGDVLTGPAIPAAVPQQTLATTAAFTTVTPAGVTDVVADDALKIPPRFHLKTRSRYVWTCDDGSTYFAWADQVIGTSLTTFGFVP